MVGVLTVSFSRGFESSESHSVFLFRTLIDKSHSLQHSHVFYFHTL